MINIIPLPAFKDNYIWLLINPANQSCVAVDPGDADPVLAYLEEQELKLDAILITHHHHDHTGGIVGLHARYPNVQIYGPAQENIPEIDHKLKEGDTIELPTLGMHFTILDIPGHTRGHIAYYGENMLFCGDTLFASGCGRLFEGTAEQMYQSLSKIAQLPDNTAIYCAHEYTQANLRFAETVEPNNSDIQTRIKSVNSLREKNLPTLPSILSLEKLTNPFLRCQQASVSNAAQIHAKTSLDNATRVFATIRDWKDSF